MSVTEEETVYAFDIDGALTSKEGLERYREVKDLRNVRVGVVSARSKRSALNFLDKTGLQPDFIRTGAMKGRILRDISDSGVYIGSWVRDRFHAKVAGWEYSQI